MSQGQRFRRRALRRGYKVDEVDSFLDRVESTLAGDPMGTPITAQEVHDVVFRVRFGGYDEWQVDLHLDRVERQLAELEERGGSFARGLADRAPAELRPSEMRPAEVRMAPQERMGPPNHMGPPERMGPPGPPPHERMMPIERVPPDRMMPERIPPERMVPPVVSPLPPRPMPAGPPRDYGRYDEPTFGGGFEGYEPPPRRGRSDSTTEIRLPGAPPPDPNYLPPPDVYGGGPPPSSEAARIDQLRRTFQLRRFGSGYDRSQVDRLFEAIIASVSGRGGGPSDADLDPAHFNLVPGGYFEAEVDAALKEVRDILLRRR